METAAKNIHERHLQRMVHVFLDASPCELKTGSGKRAHILSPGVINVYGGPDFRNIAMLLDGRLVIGDAEFHRKSSEWLQHRHHENHEYDNVVLHIVFENDLKKKLPHEILKLDREKLVKKCLPGLAASNKLSLSGIEELKDFAFKRLKRLSGDADRLASYMPENKAFTEFASIFIEKYKNKRKRPYYNCHDLDSIPLNMMNSKLKEIIPNIRECSAEDLKRVIINFHFIKINGAGKKLKTELLINCVLPFAYSQGNAEIRTEILNYYWSIPAAASYGKLLRKFPELPQQYCWQQQGMLEYLAEFGSFQERIAESVIPWDSAAGYKTKPAFEPFYYKTAS